MSRPFGEDRQNSIRFVGDDVNIDSGWGRSTPRKGYTNEHGYDGEAADTDTTCHGVTAPC